MKRIISILLENKPGALARVVGLFHQRGYNIESLNVGPVFDGTYSRMTVTTRGSENDVEQITKQINKIIDVIKVSDLTEGEHHEYEFILIKYNKFKLTPKIQKALKPLSGKVLEKNIKVIVMSAFGSSSDVEKAIKTIGKANLLEIARSGCLGLHEGEKVLKI
jgi:acetolactate synthase-1/3 small subunit|tara:strand:- start:231 stop:719 length:489 start_codon:yes stop_codon:yes gene_type:complete